ncbi:alcohol dehydrogenase [Orrella sp. 11846]|uniref:alcohol dehydrogenase n=1 Tax=Orrella sp. 11846 TaxID=3409913 RepID=UPI003B5BD9B2
MRCQCVVSFGKPLVAQEREDLVPEGTEVIMKITAAGVCHSDLHIRDGFYDLGDGKKMHHGERGLHLPRVMGHEPVGVIAAKGPLAGDLDTSRTYVVYPWAGCGTCERCIVGDEHYCPTPRAMGIHVDGAYATQMRVPHPRYLFDIGDMDPAHAAPLACSGLTAFSALKKVEASLSKAPVVIIGVGGVGLNAVQLAKSLGGMAPIAVDIDPKKREAALTHGAGHAIDGSAPDVIAQIHAAAGGAPLAAIDFVGSEQTAKLGFDVLTRAGQLVIVGLFGGRAPWPLPMLPFRSTTIMGSYTGSLNEFRELMSLAAKGVLSPLPTSRHKLDEAEEILNDLARGEIVGRAILEPNKS